MIDFLKVPSPCYLLDEELLDRNLATIDRVRTESGAEIIVALKACAMWRIFPILARHSDGATASSAAEARLVFEEYGRPAHTYAPVYTERDIDEILRYSDHITFNSLSQFDRFRAARPDQRPFVRAAHQSAVFARRDGSLQPVCPRVATRRNGRGARGARGLPEGIEGLHFHVLCESRPEHLRLALEAVGGISGSIWIVSSGSTWAAAI